MIALDTLSIIAMVIVWALTYTRITHSSRLTPKVPKSTLMAMGIMRAPSSKQVEVVLRVAAIRHRRTIITGMDIIAAFNRASQTLVAK
jgi:hypothetical protein